MPNLKHSLLETTGLAGLILRVPIGIIFMVHGAQKLFGAFDGKGLNGFAAFLASLGIEHSFLMAILTGSAEFFGGLCLIVGLLTRLASIPLSIVLIVAIFSVHWENGLLMSANGYEFALSLLAACLALLIMGAGYLSLDRAISSKIRKN